MDYANNILWCVTKRHSLRRTIDRGHAKKKNTTHLKCRSYSEWRFSSISRIHIYKYLVPNPLPDTISQYNQSYERLNLYIIQVYEFGKIFFRFRRCTFRYSPFLSVDTISKHLVIWSSSYFKALYRLCPVPAVYNWMCGVPYRWWIAENKTTCSRISHEGRIFPILGHEWFLENSHWFILNEYFKSSTEGERGGGI